QLRHHIRRNKAKIAGAYRPIRRSPAGQKDCSRKQPCRKEGDPERNGGASKGSPGKSEGEHTEGRQGEERQWRHGSVERQDKKLLVARDDRLGEHGRHATRDGVEVPVLPARPLRSLSLRIER